MEARRRSVPRRRRRGQVGSIVFHDAWPTSWPRLIVDIVNNHHPSYYRGKVLPATGIRRTRSTSWPCPPVRLLIRPAQAAGRRPGRSATASTRMARRRPDSSRLRRQDDRGLWPIRATDHQFRRGWRRGQGRPVRPGRAPFGPGRQRRHSSRGTIGYPGPDHPRLPRRRQPGRPGRLRPPPRDAPRLLRWWWRTMHAGHLVRKDLRSSRHGSGAIPTRGRRPDRPGCRAGRARCCSITAIRTSDSSRSPTSPASPAHESLPQDDTGPLLRGVRDG